MAGAEWLNRYVSIEKEATYGTEPEDATANDRLSQVYGEVDDESFKATFDLLVRSDMARQVASKAVTNTRYTEGSINFAVQPDDFMGNILASFFTKKVHSTFYDEITFAGRGFGYSAGSGAITDDAGGDGVDKIGYWQIRNGEQGRLGAQLDASSTADFVTNGVGVIVLESVTAYSAGDTTGWGQHNGVEVTASNPGYGIIGSATGGNAGGYFKYTGINDSSNQLTGVTTYASDSTFTTAAVLGSAIPDNTTVIAYENYYNGIEPGRVYGYITIPGSAETETSLDVANDFFGLAALLDVGDDTGGTAITTPTATVGGSKKHIFEEPTLSTESYPSYTIRVGREDKEHTFTGMTATRLSLSANLNEYVMASVDFLGQSEAAPSDIQTSFSYSGNDVDALHFAEAELFVDGSANKSTKIRSISLEININRDLDSLTQ